METDDSINELTELADIADWTCPKCEHQSPVRTFDILEQANAILELRNAKIKKLEEQLRVERECVDLVEQGFPYLARELAIKTVASREAKTDIQKSAETKSYSSLVTDWQLYDSPPSIVRAYRRVGRDLETRETICFDTELEAQYKITEMENSDPVMPSGFTLPWDKSRIHREMFITKTSYAGEDTYVVKVRTVITYLEQELK